MACYSPTLVQLMDGRPVVRLDVSEDGCRESEIPTEMDRPAYLMLDSPAKRADQEYMQMGMSGRRYRLLKSVSGNMNKVGTFQLDCNSSGVRSSRPVEQVSVPVVVSVSGGFWEADQKILRPLALKRKHAMTKCFVPSCKDESGNKHRLPDVYYTHRFELWKRILTSPKFKELSNGDIYKKLKICSWPFGKECFSPGTKRLSPNSVPNLNLPGKNYYWYSTEFMCTFWAALCYAHSSLPNSEGGSSPEAVSTSEPRPAQLYAASVVACGSQLLKLIEGCRSTHNSKQTLAKREGRCCNPEQRKSRVCSASRPAREQRASTSNPVTGKLVSGPASSVPYFSPAHSLRPPPATPAKLLLPSLLGLLRDHPSWRLTRVYTTLTIWATLNIEVLIADEGDRGVYGAAPECKGGGNGRSPRKPADNGIVRQGDFHMRKSGVTRPGIEPGSPWWEASREAILPTRGGLVATVEDAKDSPGVLFAARQSMIRCCTLCTENAGGHFEHAL
ncbi:hypothetical protein PR048_007034 [Dryococelus australis]|uniref:THAP-type domain-containing protein n=1 Tax=Dryococelus australis TaxID=614101 RepID=A0ABQ9IER5_9NEOP|nr:hypothetical protein PR048_007034 [Dryococelus australis]